MEDLKSARQRRQAIAWAICLPSDAPVEPNDYERHLVEQYAHGLLTLDEVLVLLDKQVAHILYRSTAKQWLSETQLLAIHAEAQLANQQHGVTGLLCYSQGNFVQLLEGPPPAIATLFTNIRQDNRHHRVICLRDGAGPTRWFPDWSMAFLQPDPLEFYWVTNLLEVQRSLLAEPIPLLEEPHFIMEPHLLTLLHAFSTL